MSVDEFLQRFAVYIISYKRPGRVTTLNMLQRYGYTGRTFIVVDDRDPTLPEYQEHYGEMLRIYSKEEMARRYDCMDNFGADTWPTAWFPRNAVNEIAQEDGVDFYCVLDDDYTAIELRCIVTGEGQRKTVYYIVRAPLGLSWFAPRFLNHLFHTLAGMFSLSPHIVGVGIAQSGDFVGGRFNLYARRYMWPRKLMNFFVLSTQRPVEFLGRMNEDVNTYVHHSWRGKIFFTVPLFSIKQKRTQHNPGGVTETYLREGTYVKSFYSVMVCPAGVRISVLSSTHPRIHHRVLWRYVAPRIISEKWRKTTNKTDV